MSLAVGGGLGNFFGGLLYDMGKRTGFTALPWLVCATVGIVTAIGLRLALRPQDYHRSVPLPAGQ
ncbi:MAG: hypothetical protein ACR2J8_00885 [Thermomicrobiales bacterium]